MEILIWIGAAISVAGMAGLIYCIARVARAKRAGLDDDALRAEVGKVVPLNLGALFLSVIGLMVVVLGIFFVPLFFLVVMRLSGRVSRGHRTAAPEPAE